MAETSGFFGSTAGDRKYTSTQFAFALDTITKSASGVVRGFENELALTSNGAGSGLVNTGRAVHDGRWYKNDSSASKVLSAVTINNKRRDRFVIRYDSVTARSAVITVINGVETTGTPSAPAIGANDVLLGYIESFNNGGVYSYTAVDERVYAFDNIISADMIADDAIGQDQIADNAIGTAQIQDDAITQAEIADNAIGTPQIIDDAVTNAELANMAQATIKGRASGAGTGDPTDLSDSQVHAIVSPLLLSNVDVQIAIGNFDAPACPVGRSNFVFIGTTNTPGTYHTKVPVTGTYDVGYMYITAGPTLNAVTYLGGQTGGSSAFSRTQNTSAIFMYKRIS